MPHIIRIKKTKTPRFETEKSLRRKLLSLYSHLHRKQRPRALICINNEYNFESQIKLRHIKMLQSLSCEQKVDRTSQFR